MGFVDLRIFVLRQVVCTGHLFRNQTKPSKSLNQFMRQSGTAKKAGSGFPSAALGAAWLCRVLGAALAAQEEAVAEGQGTGEVWSSPGIKAAPAALGLPLFPGHPQTWAVTQTFSKVEHELLGKCWKGNSLPKERKILSDLCSFLDSLFTAANLGLWHQDIHPCKSDLADIKV